VKKKVTARATNPITDDGLLSNSRSWTDFMDKDTLSVFCGRDEWRQRLIRTMYRWSEDPKSLEVMQFCIEYKIPYMTLREWEMKYPDIAEAYANIKRTIACHRRMGSMNKKLDGAYAYKDMHMYDPEWHAINKYHSDMKKEEDKQSHTFVINNTKPRVVSAAELASKVESEQ